MAQRLGRAEAGHSARGSRLSCGLRPAVPCCFGGSTAGSRDEQPIQTIAHGQVVGQSRPWPLAKHPSVIKSKAVAYRGRSVALRSQSVRIFPVHRPLQYRGSEPCFQALNGQVRAVSLSDSSCVCRSRSLSFAALNVSRKWRSQGPQHLPSDGRSWRTDASKYGVSSPPC